ncbi:MAG: hypothetical protein ABIC40_08615 [bacterium]
MTSFENPGKSFFDSLSEDDGNSGSLSESEIPEGDEKEQFGIPAETNSDSDDNISEETGGETDGETGGVSDESSDKEPRGLFDDLPIEPEVEQNGAEDLPDFEIKPDEKTDPDEMFSDTIVRLEDLLYKEFGDTLTGPNALMLPIGLLTLLFALVGWLLRPIISWFGFLDPLESFQDIILVSAGVLTLAGFHMIFYWSMHRISNAVKIREYDRIIGIRREKFPCRHLDCDTETFESEEEDFESTSHLICPREHLKWRCNLFAIELEKKPLCVVCDMYDPEISEIAGAKDGEVTV